MKRWLPCSQCEEEATDSTGTYVHNDVCEKCLGRMAWCARRGHVFKSTPTVYDGYFAQLLWCKNCGFEDYDLQDFRIVPPPKQTPLIPLRFPVCMECHGDASHLSGLHDWLDLCLTCFSRMAWCARRGHAFLRKSVIHEGLPSHALFCTNCHYKTIEPTSFVPVPERKSDATMPAAGHGKDSKGKSSTAYLRLVKPARFPSV
jgi:hypothetical protein